jgi:hypothetical protein
MQGGGVNMQVADGSKWMKIVLLKVAKVQTEHGSSLVEVS